MSQRYQELDALRGIAAMAVVVFHFTTSYARRYGYADGTLPFNFWLGEYGVHLFFIISGYVIFFTLDKNSAAFDFLVARFSRLYPAYWIAVLATFTADKLFPVLAIKPTVLELAGNLFMIQQWLGIRHIDIIYWTLTYELSFYLLMLTIFRFQLQKRMNIVLVTWLLAAIILRMFIGDGHLSQLIKMGLCLGYVHLFGAGIIFYKIRTEGMSLAKLIIIFICLLFHVLWDKPYTILIIGSFFGVFYLFITGRLRMLAITPLIFLGTISYPLYLIHHHLGFIIINKCLSRGVSTSYAIVIAVIVSTAIASSITFLVERPSLVALRGYYRSYKVRHLIPPVAAVP